jgi:endonuclease YncB( thermonuclease family)
MENHQQATIRTPRSVRKAVLFCGVALAGISVFGTAHAAGCLFESQGEDHVAAIVDARTFRLTDGRDIRLAGIEPAPSEYAVRNSALSDILNGHDVTLRGPDDTPDRYGRQSAFVFLDGGETSVQAILLSQGNAVVSSLMTDKDCSAALTTSEAAARQAKRGIWSDPSTIKSAGSTDDILAAIGRFTLVEGKVLSVRQAGATTYLNFGRNWTRDFAVTISRRIMASVEAAGMAVKSLENKRIRVRGWVEARTGPRIELRHAGQIEVLDGN